jgi:hypothetical protein
VASFSPARVSFAPVNQLFSTQGANDNCSSSVFCHSSSQLLPCITSSFVLLRPCFELFPQDGFASGPRRTINSLDTSPESSVFAIDLVGLRLRYSRYNLIGPSRPALFSHFRALTKLDQSTVFSVFRHQTNLKPEIKLCRVCVHHVLRHWRCLWRNWLWPKHPTTTGHRLWCQRLRQRWTDKHR